MGSGTSAAAEPGNGRSSDELATEPTAEELGRSPDDGATATARETGSGTLAAAAPRNGCSPDAPVREPAAELGKGRSPDDAPETSAAADGSDDAPAAGLVDNAPAVEPNNGLSADTAASATDRKTGSGPSATEEPGRTAVGKPDTDDGTVGVPDTDSGTVEVPGTDDGTVGVPITDDSRAVGELGIDGGTAVAGIDVSGSPIPDLAE
jgi:hypothetical protein